jgi:hypothetical protein
MYLSEEIQKKWAPILEHPDLPAIKDSYRKAVTAMVLENQERAVMEEYRQLNETSTVSSGHWGGAQAGFSGGANASGPVAGFDPILISLVRRSLPNLIAYDVCGVQPMSGPTGLIFAMRSTYATQNLAAGGATVEAFFGEANTGFAGISGAQTTLAVSGAGSTSNVFTSNALACTAMSTATAETLDTGFQEMAFAIEKVTVTAKTRALKAEYTMELAQDLKAVHGLDAETELSNILSAEILAEINREVIRTIYGVAKIGCENGTTTAGRFDLDVDSNGRWMVEKIKGLAFQIEREANTIAKNTRRGKGNILITSSDVASALAMAGILDYASALKDNINLTVDDTGNTFAGTLFGRIKVYIDPYAPTAAQQEFAVVGYKGANAYDAGIFYCPYVPLQMVRAVDTGTFQPKIGFKTRYGLVANPFAGGTTQGLGLLTAQSNNYYRAFKVANLM